MSRPAILIFDLGGVLVDFAGFEELPKLAPGLGDRPALRERWIRSPAVRAFERGALSPAEFGGRFVAEWGLSISPGELEREVAGWAREPLPGALDLLDRLVGRIPLACLSNSNALHTARHRAHVGRYFAHLFFSDELGQVKPDEEIFLAVEEALGRSGPTIVFFDDTEANVEAARSRGWTALRVEGVADLERGLVELGVLDRDRSAPGISRRP